MASNRPLTFPPDGCDISTVVGDTATIRQSGGLERVLALFDKGVGIL